MGEGTRSHGLRSDEYGGRGEVLMLSSKRQSCRNAEVRAGELSIVTQFSCSSYLIINSNWNPVEKNDELTAL